VCAEGLYWWEIYTVYQDGGVLGGWTAEGNRESYWLEPVTTEPLDCSWDNSYWKSSLDISYIELADQAYEHRMYTSAVVLYTCAIQSTTPERQTTFYDLRGNAYIGAKDYKRALSDFNLSLAAQPDNYDAMIDRASVYQATGEYRKALDDVNYVLSNAPLEIHKALASVRRGYIYADLGYYRNSEIDFQNALEIYGQDYGIYRPLEPLMGLGDSYMKQGDPANATLYYYRALHLLSSWYDIGPADFAPMNLGLGKAYDALGLYPQALGAYESYLQGVTDGKLGTPDEQAAQRAAELNEQGVVPFVPASGRPEITHDASDSIRVILSDSDKLDCRVDWSPDGRFLAAGNLIFEPAMGIEPVHQFAGTTPNEVAFSPDGQFIALGLNGQGLELRDAISGDLITKLVGGGNVSFSADGRMLATTSENTAIVYGMEDYHLVSSFTAQDEPVSAVSISPDGKLLATAGWWTDKTVRVWNVKTGDLVKKIAVENYPFDVQFSPDGKWLAVGDRDHIQLWETKRFALVGRFRDIGLIDGGGKVGFSSDSSLLITPTWLGLRVYDVLTGHDVAYWQKDEFPKDEKVKCFDISPDNKQIALIVDYWTGHDDLYIWNLQSGR
jgi:tetratricopeptide (TPR) repeat protein